MSFRGRGKRGGFGGNNNNNRNVFKRGGKQQSGGPQRRFVVSNKNDDLPRIVISNLPTTADAQDVMDYLKSKSHRPNMNFKGHEFRNQRLFLTVEKDDDVLPLINLSGQRYGGDKIFISRENRTASSRLNKPTPNTLVTTRNNKRENVAAKQTLRAIEKHLTTNYTPDSPLIDLSYIATTESINFNESNTLRPLFRILAEKCPKANTISFSHNNITSLSPFLLMTRSKLENLINFNFDSNKISSFDELDYLSDLPLRELLLSNNPIASQPNYRMEVAKRFPDLEYLDSVKITQADFPPSPCPPLRPSYCDQIERQQFAYRFLQKYFTTFDEDRSSIVKAYSDESIFSMTFSTGDDPKGQVKQFSRSNRNLLKSLDLTKRTQLLYVGFEKIYNFFKLFPATTHNLTTPVVDVFLVEPTSPEAPQALYVITHGYFTETTFCTKRSFDRVFVLAPASPNSEAAKQGWEAVILNEQLHIRPYVRFPRLEPVDAAPVPAPAPASTPERDSLLMQFKAMTSLKDEVAIDCLNQSGWDINNANAKFQEFKSQGKIPQECFIS